MSSGTRKMMISRSSSERGPKMRRSGRCSSSWRPKGVVNEFVCGASAGCPLRTYAAPPAFDWHLPNALRDHTQTDIEACTLTTFCARRRLPKEALDDARVAVSVQHPDGLPLDAAIRVHKEPHHPIQGAQVIAILLVCRTQRRYGPRCPAAAQHGYLVHRHGTTACCLPIALPRHTMMPASSAKHCLQYTSQTGRITIYLRRTSRRSRSACTRVAPTPSR